MESKFQENLKKLAKIYSQRQIAEKTGFSQSSINNYLTKSSEPSIQFLIALKNAFGFSVDEFLFSDFEERDKLSYDRFIGNYIVYYYNNSSYKGEVHTNLKNTLSYGVVSIVKENNFDNNVKVIASFFKDRVGAVKLLSEVNSVGDGEIENVHKASGAVYYGDVNANQQSLFIYCASKEKGDQTFMIFNNPPSTSKYIGGIGTVNSISRGREHNPCVQFIIISRGVIDKPDGEIYNALKFDDIDINFDDSIKDIIDLFKRLYAEKNELAVDLTESQKEAIIRNKLEYHFDDMIESNVFRFAKISYREDDHIYKLLREVMSVNNN